MKENAKVYAKKTTKNGKEFVNLFVEVTLVNGDKVTMQIKQAFYNSKLAYKLIKQLPYENK